METSWYCTPLIPPARHHPRSVWITRQRSVLRFWRVTSQTPTLMMNGKYWISNSKNQRLKSKRTHWNRVQAAAGSRVQQTTPEQRVQRLNEAKTQGLIIDFGPSFIKCRCRVDIKLDSGDRQTVQKLKSGKSRKKLPKRCKYDLSKYDRHLQRCPWVTGSKSKSRTKQEYIPVSS